MINTKQGTWLLAVLGFIMVILLGILFFVPAKKQPVVIPEVKGITIISPKLNEEISSPLKITGVTNSWNGFEGQVGTVKLFDNNGEQLGQTAILSAATDWTKPPISFTAILNFTSPNLQNGTLVFYSENPSGLPQYDKTFSLPVKLSQSKTILVGVFFGNQALSSSSEQDDCKRVYKSNRDIGETVAVAEAAINELLRGPSEVEKLAGFFTNIPVGSKLNSISITNGVAKADFNAVTESGGGSCSMAARVAQINQTLKQFSTVSSVILSINGRTEDIFQP